MKPIYYKDDFPLAMRLKSEAGEAIGVPDFDFIVRLISGSREFIAGRFGGQLRNCRIAAFDPEVLEIVCNNHNLLPCSELIAEVIYKIPDSDYPDGIHEVTKRYRTYTALTASSVKCAPAQAEFTAILPFIKGEKGDPFKFSDFTGEQLASLTDPIKESFRNDINNAAADIEAKLQEGVTNTLATLETDVADLRKSTSELSEELTKTKDSVDPLYQVLGIDKEDPQFTPIGPTLQNHQECIDELYRQLDDKAGSADLANEVKSLKGDAAIAKGELIRRMQTLTDSIGMGRDRAVWLCTEPAEGADVAEAEAIFDAEPIESFEEKTSPDGYAFRQFMCLPKNGGDMYDSINFSLKSTAGKTSKIRPRAVEFQAANDWWGDGRWRITIWYKSKEIFRIEDIVPPRFDRDTDFAPMRFEIPADVLPEAWLERDRVEFDCRYYSRNDQAVERGFAVGRVAMYYDSESNEGLDRINEIDSEVKALQTAIADIEAGAMPSISAEEVDALFE